MQAYLKTAMPFYGVKKPSRLPIERDLAKRYKPACADEYAAHVAELWACPPPRGEVPRAGARSKVEVFHSAELAGTLSPPSQRGRPVGLR